MRHGAEQDRRGAEVDTHVRAARRQPQARGGLTARAPPTEMDLDRATTDAAGRLDPGVCTKSCRDAEGVEGAPRPEGMAVDGEAMRPVAEGEASGAEHSSLPIAIDAARNTGRSASQPSSHPHSLDMVIARSP